MLELEIKNKLKKRKKLNLQRIRHRIIKNECNHIYIGGETYINFSSNDYLGLNKHPGVFDGWFRGVKKYGLGSGGSPLVCGYTEAQNEFECAFSQWFGCEKSILFNSGYQANIGLLSALLNKNKTIYADKLCHASIIDGMLLSRANYKRYHHNDMQHLASLINKVSADYIISESIFSMEGDIAPIKDLVAIAKKNHAGLIIDDAHGIGVLGKDGKGVVEQFNMQENDYACIVVPLGKAFNASGSMVCGSSDYIETMVQFARSYGYSTAPSPALSMALLATLDVLKNESWRRERLKLNIRYFIYYAQQKKLKLISFDVTPIKSIIINNVKDLMRVHNNLLDKGFYVSAIRPPTVPINKQRLRISVNCLHTHEQITALIDSIAEAVDVDNR